MRSRSLICIRQTFKIHLELKEKSNDSKGLLHKMSKANFEPW